MKSKICIFIFALSIMIMNAFAECPIPARQIRLRRIDFEDFEGSWYSQGFYDQLNNPSNVPACSVIEYSTVSCGENCVNDTVATVHKVLSTTCGGDLNEYHSNVVKDAATGMLVTQTKDAVTGAIIREVPCYLIAYKPNLYHVAYCCREVSEGVLIEALYYYTKSSNPEPMLTMKMQRKAIKADLEETAAKVPLIVPGACSST